MNKHLVPFVRFRDYQSIWKEYKIGEIFTVTRGQVLATSKTSTIKSLENPYPVYSSQTKNNGLMGFYKSYLFDTAITWTTDGANAGTVKFRSGKFYSTNVNGVLLSNNGYTNVAVAEALNKVAWKYVSKVGNPKLMNNVMSEIKLRLPESIKEQNEISSFFKSLDDTISLHQQELEALKQTKQGFLQKMFPKDGETVPALRFKGFTENWNEERLANLADFSKGSGYSKGDLIAEGTPILLYGQLYTNYKSVISSVSNYVNEKEKSVISVGNEVVVPASGESAEDIARASAITVPDIIIGGDLNIIRPTNKVEPIFLALALSNGKVQRELSKFAQGKSVVHLQNSEIKKVQLLFPEIEEQLKIGEFFRQLDEVIELKEKEIEALKETKKGFLQKMFV